MKTRPHHATRHIGRQLARCMEKSQKRPERAARVGNSAHGESLGDPAHKDIHVLQGDLLNRSPATLQQIQESACRVDVAPYSPRRHAAMCPTELAVFSE